MTFRPSGGPSPVLDPARRICCRASPRTPSAGAIQAGPGAFAAATVSRAMRLAVIAAVRGVLATYAVGSAPSYKTTSASASGAESATPVSAASARRFRAPTGGTP
jgi:hypothetical protein